MLSHESFSRASEQKQRDRDRDREHPRAHTKTAQKAQAHPKNPRTHIHTTRTASCLLLRLRGAPKILTFVKRHQFLFFCAVLPKFAGGRANLSLKFMSHSTVLYLEPALSNFLFKTRSAQAPKHRTSDDTDQSGAVDGARTSLTGFKLEKVS